MEVYGHGDPAAKAVFESLSGQDVRQILTRLGLEPAGASQQIVHHRELPEQGSTAVELRSQPG